MSMNNELMNSQLTVKSAITLTPEQSLKFQKTIKIGVYKELHRRGLLTDTQLKQLIYIQNT